MYYTSFLIIITRANATIPEKGGGGDDGGDGARGVADGGASEGKGMLGSGRRSDDVREGPTTAAQLRGRRRGWRPGAVGARGGMRDDSNNIDHWIFE
jgi:hypothetical protein